jgi:hypothetical protein
MWPEPSSPLLQASPSRVLPQRNRELPYSPDGGLNSFPPRRLTAKGLSHRKRIALFAVLTVSHLVGSPMLKLNAIEPIARKIYLSKIQNWRQQKLAKKAIKKAKPSTKKSVKEKAKATPKGKKESKREKPKKIELRQDV